MTDGVHSTNHTPPPGVDGIEASLPHSSSAPASSSVISEITGSNLNAADDVPLVSEAATIQYLLLVIFVHMIDVRQNLSCSVKFNRVSSYA